MTRFARWITVVVGIAAVGLVVGCSNMDKKLVGTYSAEMKTDDSKKDDPGAAMAQGLAKSVTMELKADKTFKMTFLFFPLEGTWATDGGKLNLTVTKAMGMSIDDLKKQNPGKAGEYEKPMTLNISDGGDTLTPIDDKSSSVSPFVFKKDKK